VAGAAALRENGHAVDHRGAARRATERGIAAEHHGAGDDFDMADDPAGEAGDESIAGIVLGVVDGGVELRLGRCRRQAGEELDDLGLVTGAGGGHLALLEHP